MFANYSGGFGSQAEEIICGLEAIGLLQSVPGDQLSGATTQTAYAGLGGSHAFEYCFAAGTLVLLADGTTKPIEKIQPGDLVLCVNDQEADSAVESRPVVEVSGWGMLLLYP